MGALRGSLCHQSCSPGGDGAPGGNECCSTGDAHHARLTITAALAQTARTCYSMAYGDLMHIPSSHRDLLEAPIPVAYATLSATGHPQVTAVWAILDADEDGDVVVTSLTVARQKVRNLRAHPQATVFVIDPANPYRTLEVRGDVVIEPDPDLITL